MKVSALALSFLILGAALGSQANIVPDLKIREHIHVKPARDSSIHSLGKQKAMTYIEYSVHHASDCCYSYTARRIRCSLMEAYFETSSGCSQPAVIFVTKNGRRVCVDPSDFNTQLCMTKLKLYFGEEIRR